jgi:hypothetical protein
MKAVKGPKEEMSWIRLLKSKVELRGWRAQRETGVNKSY